MGTYNVESYLFYIACWCFIFIAIAVATWRKSKARAKHTWARNIFLSIILSSLAVIIFNLTSSQTNGAFYATIFIPLIIVLTSLIFIISYKLFPYMLGAFLLMPSLIPGQLILYPDSIQDLERAFRRSTFPANEMINASLIQDTSIIPLMMIQLIFWCVAVYAGNHLLEKYYNK